MLMALLGIYAGTYYWLVVPVRGIDFDFSTGKAAPSEAEARYLRFSPTAQLRLHHFFSPVHRLDRLIRPHVWEAAP